MNGIDLVGIDYFGDDLKQMSFHLRQSWVIIPLGAVFEHPVAVLVKVMVGIQSGSIQVHGGPVGIEPGMEF